MPKTLQELLDAVWKVLPNATFGEDLDGQLVIYTDLKVNRGDTLAPIETCAVEPFEPT